MNPVSVQSHKRKRPYSTRIEAMSAKLMAEVESSVDRQVTAALRTFPVNVWRAEKEGRL